MPDPAFPVFIGIGRLCGQWDASANEATGSDGSTTAIASPALSSTDDVPDWSAGLFTLFGTPSIGDYFKVNTTGTTPLNGETDWTANDFIVFASGSSGKVWKRLSYTDTVASLIYGDLDEEIFADQLLGDSVADTEILFAKGATVAFSGSNKLSFNYDDDTLRVTGSIVVDNLKFGGNTLQNTNLNGSLILSTYGTGDIFLASNPVYIGDDTADTVFSTLYDASLILNTYGGTNSAYIKINKDTGGDVEVSLTTGSQFYVSGNQNPVKLEGVEAGTAATNNHYLALDSTNSLVLTNPHGDAGATTLNDLSDVAYSSGDLTITGLDTIYATSGLTLDAGGDIYFDAAGSDILFVESGTVFASFTEDGNDAYLNFGAGSTGTSGYGFRDSNGTIQWKNSSGDWANISDLDVNIANLTARLPQITENVTIGDATDVTVTLAGNLLLSGDVAVPAGTAGFLSISGSASGLAFSGSTVVFTGQGGEGYPPTIGIGVSEPTYAIHLKNVADASGQIIANAFPTYSSKRYKNNIMPITGALDKASQLRGVSFEWDGTNKKDIGFIAEEVGEIIPEIVVYEKNGIDALSLDYPKITALLVQCVKEQNDRTTAIIAAMDDALNSITSHRDFVDKKIRWFGQELAIERKRINALEKEIISLK